MTALVSRRFVTTVPNPIARGLLALLATGLLWGLVVLGPDLVPGATATSLVGGRFVVLGVTSFVAVRGRFIGVDWKRAFVYALAGFVGYYLLLVLGIQRAGAAPMAALIGITPVLYAVAGARAERLDLRRLAGPLAVLLGGVLLTHVMDLRVMRSSGGVDMAVGFALGLASILVWLWYAIDNGRFLRRTHVNSTQWTSAVGFAAGVLALPLLGHGLVTGGVGPDPMRWLLVVLALGFGSAWLGTVAWNAASKLLPESLIGPLLVIELVIGLAYAHMFTSSWPAPVTAAGYGVLVVGTVLSVIKVGRLRALAASATA